VLEGLDGLERATSLNEQLASQARTTGIQLRAELSRLSRADLELDAVEARASAATAAQAAALDAKRRTLAGIRRRQGITSARLAAAEERAQAAQREAARITRAARRAERPAAASAGAVDADAAPPPAAAAPGGRLFVADAVAYHLPGRTASGLPVGVGVIAVDPAVIPLGTRVFVPGYGPAVAADVGSAIKGNIIDLWMPSTAAARAWGRRTVTITVYG
jgi:3D (Asp-Asp-Asp) domain-containing protein